MKQPSRAKVRHGRHGKVTFEVGRGLPTRVMALLGTGPGKDVYSQEHKLQALTRADAKPDIVSDLSYVHEDKMPLWRRIVESTDFVAATLPVYRCETKGDRVDSSELAAIAVEQMESGVGILTIHVTPMIDLVRLSTSRLVPWTSRGGGIVIRDLLAGRREMNVYFEILPLLVSTAKKTGTVISLGTSFRSANIFDAGDRVHFREMELQIEIARQLARDGVDVIIEAPGHARPSAIRQLAVPLRRAGFPVMPLGPMPTDVGFSNDHVAAAIGSTLLGLEGCAQIIAAVTREEHLGGIPSENSTLEAVACARLAAHIIDLGLPGFDEPDRAAAMARAEHHTCIAGKSTPGCSRCSRTCPL